MTQNFKNQNRSLSLAAIGSKAIQRFQMGKGVRTSVFLSTFVLVAVLFTACVDLDRGNETIAGKGPVVTADYDISLFKSIHSAIGANVNIIEAEHPRVSVSMQENLFQYLTVKNEGDNLSFSFGNRTIQSAQLVVIDVYTPNVEKFHLTGAGVILSDLPVKEIHVSGSGGFRFKGASEEVLVNVSGVAEVNLFDMPVNKADIRIAGSATVRVHVAQTLNVFISGVGNIYYKGNPTISQTVSGVGNIEKVD